MMYEIQVNRVFSAAHALKLPDGSMEPTHGHNWDITVTVGAPQLDAMGTVMDFHLLEQWLAPPLARAHNQNLNMLPPFCNEQGQLVINPSAECVAKWLADEITQHLPAHVKLLAVQVSEAPGCRAIYRPGT